MKGLPLAAGWLSALMVTGCVRVAALPSAPDAGEPGGARLSAVCEDAKDSRERASACFTLAGYFDEGVFGLPQDPVRAAMLRADGIDALQASCDLGNVENCTRAASAIDVALRSTSAPAPAASELATWLTPYAEDGCSGGDAAGCALLGRIYEQGSAVARDPARSMAYYHQACVGGHRRSCLLLAQRAQGKDAQWAYERACDAGSGFGCAAAGLHFQKDAGATHGVDKVVYFARGCAMGDPASCVLGAETFRRDGVSDRRGAVSFAWTGCQQGIPDACQLLGEALQRGEGVPKNEDAAREAYQQACEAGLPKACAALRAMGAY